MEVEVKEHDEDTKGSFCHYVNEMQGPCFVFLGYVGRKGPKEDAHVLGSVTDIAMRACIFPVIICKTVPTTKNNTYIVCIDGSKRSYASFEAVLSLAKPIDKITVVHMADILDIKKTDEMRKVYETAFDVNGLIPENNKFVALDKVQGEPASVKLAEYITACEATYVVLSPNPQMIRAELSMSETLIKNCKRQNFILFKVE
jgi:hypothetical protein